MKIMLSFSSGMNDLANTKDKSVVFGTDNAEELCCVSMCTSAGCEALNSFPLGGSDLEICPVKWMMTVGRSLNTWICVNLYEEDGTHQFSAQ